MVQNYFYVWYPNTTFGYHSRIRMTEDVSFHTSTRVSSPCLLSSSNQKENKTVHQKTCKKEGVRVRDDGQKLHLCHRHCCPAPHLHKRASNRYWDIDHNTLQSCEEFAISFTWSSHAQGGC
ncbi:hypothetical protein ACSBR1_035397 [Camellia fascicularis]